MRLFRGKMHYFNKVAAGENEDEDAEVVDLDDTDTESEIDESDVEAVYEPGTLINMSDSEDSDFEIIHPGEMQHNMIHLVGGTGSINLQTIVNNVVDNVIALTQNTVENSDANMSAGRSVDTSSAPLNNNLNSENATSVSEGQEVHLGDGDSTPSVNDENSSVSSSTTVPSVGTPANNNTEHNTINTVEEEQIPTISGEPESSKGNIRSRNVKRRHSGSSDDTDISDVDKDESEEFGCDESDQEPTVEKDKVAGNKSQCKINVAFKDTEKENDIVNDVDDAPVEAHKCKSSDQTENLEHGTLNLNSAVILETCDDELENSDSYISNCNLSEDRNKSENYCNPMVSDSEEEIDHDVILRGDRIGSTTYSERHVLKLLMKWAQELPPYMSPNSKDIEDEALENKPLEIGFEEDMSLLWDMSAEADVMSYLVDNNVFTLIRDTLEGSGCNRLTEVALGIMANLLSQKSILEDFHVHDAKLKLVYKVTLLVEKVSNVAVLIQIFAVLKRIVWFIKNVKTVDEWVALFLSGPFLNCANFMLVSSTNFLLLGDVITTLYTLLETLCADNLKAPKGGEEKEDFEDENEENDQSLVPKDSFSSCEYFLPFCETNFVSSLCEGLNELLKNPKPKPSTNTTFTGEKTGEADDGFDIDIPIPDNHVQTAILNGLGCLTYLKRTGIGKDVLIENKDKIISFILNFHRKFELCTEKKTNSDTIEYFVLSLRLLGFCHKHMSTVSQDAVLIPVSAASKLITREEKSVEEDREKLVIRTNSGVHFDAVTYIALAMHNYISLIMTTFGEAALDKVRQLEKYKTFFGTVDKIVETVSRASEGSTVC